MRVVKPDNSELTPSELMVLARLGCDFVGYRDDVDPWVGTQCAVMARRIWQGHHSAMPNFAWRHWMMRELEVIDKNKGEFYQHTLF